MKHRRFRISDHALVRYLERVRGVDIAALRKEIRAQIEIAGKHPGASAIVRDGYKYHIENGTLKTITPASPTKHTTNWRRK